MLKIKKKILTAVSIAGIFSLLLTGCGGSSKQAGLYDAEGNVVMKWDETSIDLSADKELTSVMNDEDSLYHLTTNNENIVSIVVPDSIEKIGKGAFAGCMTLTSIELGKNVSTISENAFYLCSAITSLDIPASVTSIDKLAFLGNTSLTEINIDEANETYDSRDNCNAIIESASNVLQFGCQASTIPEGVVTIGTNAFNYCYGLKNVTFPSSLKTIENYAFANCTDLESIEISSNVISISEAAYENTISVSKITVAEDNTVYDSRNDCNAIMQTAENVLIKGCVNTVIPEDTESIGNYAFKDCTNLEKIILPESVVDVGNYAFQGCTALKSITLPSDIVSLGDYAFFRCSELSEIKLPDNLQYIGAGTFCSCEKLESITLPNGLIYLGYSAFTDCTNLKEVIYNGETYTSIDKLTKALEDNNVEVYDSVFAETSLS